MDVIKILKDAWAVTWREKKLWILGLFVGGSAGTSGFNWQMDSSDWQNRRSGDWEPLELHDPELQQAADEVRHFFESGVDTWLPWVLLGIGVLLLIGIVFFVLNIAARGGLVDQTNAALAGRAVSVGAGWRTGFRRWGRVFAVGFLLALPLLVLGALVAGAFAAVGAVFFVDAAGPAPGLLGLGLLVPLALLVFIPLSVIVGLLYEVALRHAVLGDERAVDSIKSAWADLTAKRGVFTMWLVMFVVGIGVAVASGIVLIPLAVLVALLTGAAVVGFGLPGLWVLLPLGLLAMAVGMAIKAAYSTFHHAAWTQFYRLQVAGGEGGAGTAAPPTPDVTGEGAADAV